MEERETAMILEKYIDSTSHRVLGVLVTTEQPGNLFYDRSDFGALFEKYQITNARLTKDMRIIAAEGSIALLPVRCCKPDFRYAPGRTLQRLSQAPLYHATYSEISGTITPESRAVCDFGKGFYTYQDELAARYHICSDGGRLYRLSADFRELKVYQFQDVRLWSLYLAVNRGYILSGVDELNRFFRWLDDTCDVIIGWSADEKAAQVCWMYFDMYASEEQLSEVLHLPETAIQLVFKTQRACDRLHIEDVSHTLPNDKNLEDLQSRIQHTETGLPYSGYRDEPCLYFWEIMGLYKLRWAL